MADEFLDTLSQELHNHLKYDRGSPISISTDSPIAKSNPTTPRLRSDTNVDEMFGHEDANSGSSPIVVEDTKGGEVIDLCSSPLPARPQSPIERYVTQKPLDGSGYDTAVLQLLQNRGNPWINIPARRTALAMWIWRAHRARHSLSKPNSGPGLSKTVRKSFCQIKQNQYASQEMCSFGEETKRAAWL